MSNESSSADPGSSGLPTADGTSSSGGPSIGRRALFIVLLLAVAAGAAFATKWYLDRRAAQRAEVRAATEEVLAEISTLYGAMAEATENGAEAAAQLRLTLQEHLTVSDRSDEQLATDRDLQRAALVDAAEQLVAHADAPLPEIPELANEGEVRDDLEQLEERQEAARQLAQRFREDAQRAERWAAALVRLREQATRYVQTVEEQPSTHDPERLQELWQEERAVLEEYRAAAQQAREVEGLAPLASAYLDYINANIEFVDEVLGLLEDEEIDAYNQRLEEVFGAEDPFGFQQAVTQATEESLDAGVIARLAETRQRAVSFLQELQEAAATTNPTPGPVPTTAPAPTATTPATPASP